MKYAAELTAGVRFYPRGEERSAQIDDFVAAGGTAAPAQRLRQRGFFGVNHMSKEEARARLCSFRTFPRPSRCWTRPTKMETKMFRGLETPSSSCRTWWRTCCSAWA